ncbi:MAG: hypothetical protein KDB27_17885 [Planctomycetales bacterium]|nr:hypothetical protein [Planctomycetales bacterium]
MFHRFIVFFFLFGVVCSNATAQTRYRKLAPGVLEQIKPDIEEEETFSGPREIVELVADQKLNWNPNFTSKSNTLLAKAQSTTFRRQVWALEFGFKPMRMIEVDGQQVWYLLYYVKNNGMHKNPTPETDANGNVIHSNKPVNHTVRFFPNFILESHQLNRAYIDSVIPEAVAKIRRREDPNRKFYDSVSISSVPIKVSTPDEDNSVWGVATFTNVDARTDFFSVFVSGLTNAYRWQDPESFKPGDEPGSGRRYSFKTLQLNFWRPGDEIDPNEREFRYGLPTKAQLPPKKSVDELLSIYRVPERVDYQWIYR